MGRTTTHRGRYINKNHNDRKFDLSKATHINQEKIKENEYWNWMDSGSVSFRDAEIEFYKKYFKEWLADINERAERQRHPERKKSPEKLLDSKKTMPEEVIFQIGSKVEPVEHTKEDLKAIHSEYMKWHNEKFGKRVVVLNSALHMDEDNGIQHYQDRMVWTYVENGILKIGQEKALEQLGYDLPDPTADRSRFNNRKVVYTAECRQKWLDLCEKHGITVERVADKDRTAPHNLQKNDAIIMQQKKQLTLLNRENEELRKEGGRLKEKNAWYRENNGKVVNECGALSQKRKNLRDDIKALEGQISDLKAKYEELEKQPPKPRYVDVERIIEVPKEVIVEKVIEKVIEVPKEVEVIKEVEVNYKSMFQKCFNAFQKLVDWIDSKFHCMNDFYGELGQDMDFLQTWKTAYPRSKARVEPLHPDGEESSQSITLSRGGR